MHGLPSGVDLSFLENATLIQVCIGENELIFSFHPDASITVMSGLACVLQDGSRHELEDPRAAAALVVLFLGLRVGSVVGAPNGDLSLEFEGGERLLFRDDCDRYESYVIYGGGGTIAV